LIKLILQLFLSLLIVAYANESHPPVVDTGLIYQGKQSGYMQNSQIPGQTASLIQICKRGGHKAAMFVSGGNNLPMGDPQFSGISVAIVSEIFLVIASQCGQRQYSTKQPLQSKSPCKNRSSFEKKAEVIVVNCRYSRRR